MKHRLWHCSCMPKQCCPMLAAQMHSIAHLSPPLGKAATLWNLAPASSTEASCASSLAALTYASHACGRVLLAEQLSPLAGLVSSCPKQCGARVYLAREAYYPYGHDTHLMSSNTSGVSSSLRMDLQQNSSPDFLSLAL